MRAFLAIELPPSVRAELAVLQRQLARAGADVKWVEEANLHVTMRFLGEINKEQQQAVEMLAGRVAAHTPAFKLRLSGLGAFPSLSSPRVIWVGVGEGRQQLARLAEAIERGLAELHFPADERAFTAHLTFGRVRSPKHRADLAAQLTAISWSPPPPFAATHLTFFQSLLGSAGPTYSPVARLALQAP